MLHIFPKQAQSPNIFFFGGILGLEPQENFFWEGRGELNIIFQVSYNNNNNNNNCNNYN